MMVLCASVEGASLAQSVTLFPLSSYLPDTPMPMPMPMRMDEACPVPVHPAFAKDFPRLALTTCSYNLQDGTKCWIIPIPCCC